MLKYLRSFGHVLLAETSLNDVDRLILAQAAYMDFSQANDLSGRPFPEALERVVFDQHADGTEMRFAFQLKYDRELCTLLRDSPRFSPLVFDSFVSIYDHEAEVQFTALCLRLPGDGLLIAYRGTDNTLAGWKEDFNLAYMERIPAQQLACRLADRLAPTASYLELTGHSKGGNLALYAAVCGSSVVQQRLRQAVSFDGPGLHQQLIESDGCRRVQSRLRLVMPRASLVALLFHQPRDVRMIESSVFSLLQHYPYTWLTEGMDFCSAEDQSESMRRLGEGIRLTLQRLDLHTRERFIEAVWEVLDATGAQTARDLVQGWVRNTRIILRKMIRTDRETVLVLLRSLGTFWLCVAEAMGVRLLPPPEDDKA
ncbi:MAG: DUF2974 domain-containing protein [Clostridia bacterium]|nr:DUF2974 domain-containing protein [Clostridia bacterium]